MFSIKSQRASDFIKRNQVGGPRVIVEVETVIAARGHP